MPEVLHDDYTTTTALVVDGNINSRAVLVAQLKDLGLTQITQCTRASDARRHIETQQFDFVLCELHFEHDDESGQDLLDDLQRNQLLPYSTVFIMITGEATYAKVAEAAESALDGYLLKPHRAANLEERLRTCRARKQILQPVFDAIDAQNYVLAIALCKQRFAAKDAYWLYSARVAADLMMRMERFADAQALYRSVVAERPVNWAKLGIARSQLEAAQTTHAIATLEALIAEDGRFADAYDVLARAQLDQGMFEAALATYKAASALTPTNISRLQCLGQMTFYMGNHGDAERMLERTARLGLDSKMFDCQSLVLLAMSRLDSEDRRGLQRCQDDFTRLLQRSPDNHRMQRLAEFTQLVLKLYRKDQDALLKGTQTLADQVEGSEFDYEIAGNLLALLAQMHLRGMPFPEAEKLVEKIGMRFCSNRAITELLARSAAVHPPFAEQVRNAQTTILELAEVAMSLRRAGDSRGAIVNLLNHAGKTLNVRLIDAAYQLVTLASTPIEDADSLKEQALELRRRAGAGNRKVNVGNQRRLAGGLVLRSATRVNAPHAPATNKHDVIDVALARQAILTR